MKSWVPIGSLFLSMEVPISLGNSAEGWWNSRRAEVEGLKAELEAVKRVVEGSGGVDGKLCQYL